jgi:hypothetical protein
MAKTAPTIDRFVFAGGRVLECENWRGVEPQPIDRLKTNEFGGALERFLIEAHEWLASRCDSPIEIILGAWLFAVMRGMETDVALCANRTDAESIAPDRVVIVPQIRWERYFPDFGIRFPLLTRQWLFVECDGKHFHFGKAKISKDRGRQQEMMDAGYRVFRFTGSEINRNPFLCASPVIHYGLRGGRT